MFDMPFDRKFSANESLILTKSTRQLLDFGKLLLLQERPHTTIGMVTGESGVGKTAAARMLYQQVKMDATSQQYSCTYCRVPPQCTSQVLTATLSASLVDALSHQLTPRQVAYRTVQKALPDLLSALQQFQKQLVIVDEAESLLPGCYELLCYIFEETRCPFLLLGTQKLPMKIQQSPLFSSNVGIHMTFMPPTEQEMLQSILPQLAIPGWSFDPQNETDLQMGKEVWFATKPSLRRLRTLLQIASQLAEHADAQRITRDILRQAFSLLAFPSRKSSPFEQKHSDTTYSEHSERKATQKRRNIFSEKKVSYDKSFPS